MAKRTALELLLHRLIPDAALNSAAERGRAANCIAIVGLLCNALLFAAKLTAGLLSHSVAITADAVNSLSDFSSSIIAWLGFKLASRPADKKHPFGHGRYEYLAALVVAVFIMVIGFEVLRSGIERIVRPADIDYRPVTFVILVCSVLLKLWMTFFYSGAAKRLDSKTFIATSADSRNDVIMSSGILLAAAISRMVNVNMDGYIAAAVAFFIIWNSVQLIKDTLSPILGEAIASQDIEAINTRILANKNVLGAHDLLVHDYGPGHVFASAHVELPASLSLVEAHAIIDSIEHEFIQDGLHLILHLDPVETETGDEHYRRHLEYLVKLVEPSLTIHDVKLYESNGHRHLSFDCLKPESVQKDPDKLAVEIKKYLEQAEKLECEVSVESFAPVQR